MITDPPALRVRRHFERPPAELVAALRGAATGHVVDASGGKGALVPEIKPIAGTGAEFCGVAIPCDAGPGDNLALFGALALAEPGDVLVVATDAYRGAAVLGDLLAGMARNSGVAAIVTDGLARDVAGLASVGLPVFAAGVSPNSPSRCGPGVVGMPIVIGGVAVEAGDIVVGDADGVVVVPRRRAADIVSRLRRVRAAEALVEAKVKAGLRMLDGVAALLASDRVENIE
jgi:4-hydroxy-4-methyl-2-oxoglutarate aldolase